MIISEEVKEKLPVPYHETFDVLDSSKIQCFMDCPRKFFFRYVLGWEKDSPNVHLIFGGAWHEAMEHFLNNGLGEVEVLEAYMRFKTYWEENYPNEWLDPDHNVKNLEGARKAISEYAQNYRPREEFKTLYTEVSGTVPVDQDTLLFVKLDSINEYEDGVIKSMEHKHTGRKTGAWLTKWPSKIQIGSYTHFLNVLFPGKADGIVINGAVIRKSSNEFIRIPTRLQRQQMQAWLWEVKHWIAQIKWNFVELAKCSPDDEVMTAFPRNSESCQKFGCDHIHLCNLMCNPLRDIEPPLGFKTEWWDPREREKKAKAVVRLEESSEIITKEPETKTQDHHSNE